jgi:hypothetical protein
MQEFGCCTYYTIAKVKIQGKTMNVHAGQQHLLFGAIHNSCKPSVKHRYSCFTTLSGGRCPPHSPPAREITSPLTPECRLRRFFIIYLKVNAVAVLQHKKKLPAQKMQTVPVYKRNNYAVI